nr:MAG: nonstructural polyprotein [Dicistroviridae sp.]
MMSNSHAKIITKQMIDDLLFKRNHPMYDDWQSWQSIVHTYYCPRTIRLEQFVNKGSWSCFNYDTLTQEEQGIGHEIFAQVSMRAAMYHQGKTWQEMWQDHTVCTAYFGCDCACFPEEDCVWQEHHLRTHLLAFMWTYVKCEKPVRAARKYYKRLGRVLLSLDYEHLKNVSLDMIMDPESFMLYGRTLLRQLYRRAHLDKYDFNNFVETMEKLKHQIPRQQSGVIHQSYNDDHEEILEIATRLVEEEDIFSLLHHKNRVKQQGIFSFEHKHSIKDADFAKLDTLLKQSQKTFTESLGDAFVSAGRNLLVMFAAATTIGILAKAAATVATKSVLHVLHLLYNMIFGGNCTQRVEHSLRIVQQSGDSTLSIPFLPAMIIEHLITPTKKVLDVVWGNPNIDKIMRRLGYLGDPKIDRGLERLAEWFIAMIKTTQMWFYRNVLGISVPADIESDSHVIIKWNEEVDEVLKTYFAGTFVWTETSWSMIYNLYARGLSFTRSRMYDRWKTDVFRVVNKLGNILEKFKQHQRDGQSIRNPPVTIYLSGGTGVGKSSVTYPLAVEILKEIFEREGQATDLNKRWKNLIYMRSAEQEFWDGYENQFVTVFDDFNQQADSASNPNLELFEIIRASNCFPYPLHMAALDQKATTTFTSKIILVSSNLKKPKTQSLNFPEALERRFEVCVDVRRGGTKKGHSNQFDPTLYHFTLYEMSTGNPIRTLTYKELISLCAQKYFSRVDFVDSIDKYIEQVLNPNPPLDEEQLELLGDALSETPKQQMGNGEEYLWDDRDIRVPRTIEYLTRHFKEEDTVSSIDPFDGESIYDDDTETKSTLFSLKPESYFDSVKERFWRFFGTVADPWAGLREATGMLRKHFISMRDAWALFRAEHPYVAKSLMVVSLLIGALVFLKMFKMVSQLACGRKDPIASQEAWGHRTPRAAKNESYTPTAIKVVPKAEAYSPTNIKTVKAEVGTSVVYDPETGMPTSQGVKDLNATEILLSVVRRNLYKMYESTASSPIGHCIFLKGKVALMPRHFMYAFKQSLQNDPAATVHFKSALLSRAFEMRISDLLKDMKMYESPEEEFGPPITRDLMAVSVDASIIHPDITQSVATRESLSRVDSTEIMIPVMVNNNMRNSTTAVMMLRFRNGRSVLSRVVSLPVGSDEVEVLRHIRDAWRYEADTQPTECGAPLLVRNSRISPGKVCGIHVAGLDGTGEGFATPLYQEDVVKILAMFPLKVQMHQVIQKQHKEFPKEQGQVPASAEFIRIGELDKPVYQPTQTAIMPSLCHGKIKPVESKPCQLRPTTEFDPRKYRLERLGNIPQALPRDIVENAGLAFLDECSSVIAVSKMDKSNLKAVYSFEEAVVGIDGEPYVNSIKRGTSPGFPYIQEKDTKTRTKFFGNGDDYDLTSDQCEVLKSRVFEIVEAARRNEVLDHYFIDTLKDERKPIHKAHKTRLFAAGPLDYLVVCKMYFNGVVALLQKSRNWSHVSVGTNPYSQDWGEIARSLLRKSKWMVAGDFEGFDASQLQPLLEASGEVFIQLAVRHLDATEDDVQIMRVLLVSLFNSFHITGKEVYQWTHSLPSGHYLTAPINSVFVNIVFACIWQIAFNDVSYIFARKLWEECGLVAYGDDHIISIPENRLEIFNQFSIPQYFKQIGLSYTMEDKDAEVTRPFRELHEINYLKRGFERDEDGHWLAPLALATVLETPMWMHKCPDPRIQTIENLEWALKELSLHKKEVWEQWAPRLWKELVELEHYTRYIHQDSTRMVCLAQTIEM